MPLENMILVSVENHLIERPTAFEGKMPSTLADETRRAIWQDNGSPSLGPASATLDV
jgi:hypothetical protein